VLFPLSIVIDDEVTHSKAELSMNRTLRGIKIDLSDESENADDSIRVSRGFDSNDMGENELQSDKYDEPRISMSFGIVTFDDLEKLRINL
jgi:hypothetical protein